MSAVFPDELVQILHDLNPWWTTGKQRREPPRYMRPGTQQLLFRLLRPKGLIEVVRGPRQVGKTTAIEQIIDHLLTSGTRPTDVLFVRFDQEVLREAGRSLPAIVRWYEHNIRRRPFEKGKRAFLFLDEVHKLERWDEDVKHLGDTYPLRMLITGSSSVLVSMGGRESLAGRAFTTDLPTFQFREMLEAWRPIAARLPERRAFQELFDSDDPRSVFEQVHLLKPQQKLSLRRNLETYYNRGGYPRLYNGEVEEDDWADYLQQTIIDRVLGVDVPDLFPVQNPQLLRWTYVEIARRTGQEVAQTSLAKEANRQGFSTSQPVIRSYMHYLADALLIREFRRYPLGRRRTSTPAKITLTDLGARNALFRGAPSLWDSAPEIVGPLVETLVQSVIRGPGIQVHFFRDHENPKDRRSPVREVDFVAEDTAGDVIPIEVKFRRRIDREDFRGLDSFRNRFNARYGVMVTRDHWEWCVGRRVLCVPVLEFLVAF